MNKSEMKEDKHYKKARFEDLHSIQIGNYFLYENDLQTYFGDDEESIILLKRIFQKQYKITRTSSGLPRVPSRPEDKQRIIQLLQSYFNRLRSKILEKRLKSGDSVSLRENIDGIQQIKLLIDHFEESTETFPYHMFKDYLDNKEYIKSTGDINKQMREFQFNRSQNERIRNLLRQFSLLYLKDKKQEQFDVRDPGVFSDRFKEFMKGRDLSKLPPILVDLLKLLDGKYSVIAQEDEKIRDELYNPDKVYSELDRLLTEIDKEVEIQKGGAKPVIDKIRGIKGLDEQTTSVVDYILQKYKELHQAHKYVILNKDSEYDMLDQESTKKIIELQENLDEAESKLSLEKVENARLNEQIANLNKDITEKNDEIEAKNESIKTLTLQLKGANDNLSRSLKNKDYSESEVSRLQQMLDTQIKTLTEQLREAQQQAANLDEEKSGIEEERNNLRAEMITKTAKVEELEAEVLRLNGLLSQQKIDLSGNDEILNDYKGDITKLELDLSGNKNALDTSKEEIRGLRSEISKKDAMILDLSSNLTRTKKQLEDANKEANEIMESSIKNIERLSNRIDQISRDKKRLEDELKECRDNLAKRLSEQKSAFDSEIAKLTSQLSSSSSAEIQRLRDELARVEKRIKDLDDIIGELADIIDANENGSRQLSADLARITAERDSLKTENKRLNELISNLKASSSGDTASLKTQREDLLNVNAELSRLLREKEDELKRVKEDRDAQIKTLNDKSLRLQGELDTVTAERDRLLAKNRQLEEDIAKLGKNIGSSTNSSVALKAQLDAAQREKKAAEDRLAEKERELAAIKSALASKDEELTRISKKSKEDLDKITAERDKALRDRDTFGLRIAELEKSLSSSTGSSGALQTQLDAAIRDKKAAEDRLAEKERELAAVKAELASKDEKILRITSEYKRNLELLNEENAALKAQVDELKAQAAINTTTAATLQGYLNQITQLSDEKAENLRRMGELERSLDDKVGIISGLERDKGILELRIQELESINRELNNRNESMNEQLREFESNKTKLKESETQIRELISKIDELNKKFDGEKQKIIDTMTKQMTSFEQSTIREKTDLLRRISELETELAATEADRNRYLEANETITATNEELKREINRIKSQLDACLDKDRLQRPEVSTEVPEIREDVPTRNIQFDNFLKGRSGIVTTIDTINSYSNDTANRDLGKQFDLLKSITKFFTPDVIEDISKDEPSFVDSLNKLKTFLRNNNIQTEEKDRKQYINTFINYTTNDFKKILEMKSYIDILLKIILVNSDIKEKAPTLTKLNEGIRRRRQYGGGANDILFDYCSKIANNSLKEFLLETPLPFFSLIKDFEKDSNLDVVQSINEEHILKLFITQHLKTYFESKEMKQFYFHAKELFGKDKESIYNNAKMFFVLQEIINTVRSDQRKIDVLRIKSKEYNSSFDYLNFILESHEYDFYNVAKKELLNTKAINMTFKDNFIYIALNDKDDHLYDFNKNLTITVSNYKYKNDIYYINDSMIYLFFILSTHFYLQSENLIDLDDYEDITNDLESTVRKLKRLKSKDKRSIETLMKERKDFKEIK